MKVGYVGHRLKILKKVVAENALPTEYLEVY